MKEINFEPTEDRLLIDPTPVEEQSEGGIIIEGNAASNAPSQGVVLKAGPGVFNSYAVVRPMRVHEGDRVRWNKFSGTELEFGGKKYLLIRESDIIGTIPTAKFEEDPNVDYSDVNSRKNDV